MIRNRTGKDPVTSPSPIATASERPSSVPTANLLNRFLRQPACRLRAAIGRKGSRRLSAALVLAASVAAACTAIPWLHHDSVAPLAQARPVLPAVEALKTQAALAPRPKHRFAAALHLNPQLMQLQRLSDLHPLRGIASWYGSVWHGHRTASGEQFDEAAMTAAHRTLPLGTVVRVTNLRTLRSVIVRINDRGTLGPGRVIDLSSAAAEQIGMLHAGVAQVKLEILQKPSQG